MQFSERQENTCLPPEAEDHTVSVDSVVMASLFSSDSFSSVSPLSLQVSWICVRWGSATPFPSDSQLPVKALVSLWYLGFGQTNVDNSTPRWISILLIQVWGLPVFICAQGLLLDLVRTLSLMMVCYRTCFRCGLGYMELAELCMRDLFLKDAPLQ